MVRFGCGVVAFIVASIIISLVINEDSNGLIVLFAWMLAGAAAAAIYTVLRTGLEAPAAGDGQASAEPTG